MGVQIHAVGYSRWVDSRGLSIEDKGREGYLALINGIRGVVGHV